MVTNDDAFPSDSTLAHPPLSAPTQAGTLPDLSMGNAHPPMQLSGPSHLPFLGHLIHPFASLAAPAFLLQLHLPLRPSK